MEDNPSFEEQCRWKCRYCQRAFEWEQRGSKGHELRFRKDTKEWVHDFKTTLKANPDPGFKFEHFYCAATEMRKQRG